MTRYIALLRGINISGKNKISMPELKAALIENDFSEVSTYLNSGNIIFSDDETDNKDIYDNLIFAIPPHKIETVAEKIGEPTVELEKVEICGNAAFWSFDRKQYAKANWWKKTAAAGIGEMITIRTANTLRKLAYEI